MFVQVSFKKYQEQGLRNIENQGFPSSANYRFTYLAHYQPYAEILFSADIHRVTMSFNKESPGELQKHEL